jgi:hypothetical protein
MRTALALAFAVVGVGACERRFSSDPPPLAPESLAPASSSGRVDPILGPTLADDAPVVHNQSHAMTVSFCSTSQPSCPASEVDASPDARYRVVFGSGHAEIRSRGQAMADLYKELRDRTSAGERLDAEARAPGDAGAAALVSDRPRAAAESSDALSQCAFHLLDLVDGVGEVTLDVVHTHGVQECMVSLGGSAGDGGAEQCLIQEPERPKRPGRGGGGRGIAF